MDRLLVHLEPAELDNIATINTEGSLDIDTGAVAKVVGRSLGLVGVRVAVDSADYLQREDGTPEPDTRTVSGIWWHSRGDDTALIGGFIIEGQALTVTTEGEGESPLAEDIEVIDRATKAIASQYEGAEIVETGLVRVPGATDGKPARVVVTRDHRVRRPQDILTADAYVAFQGGGFGLAIVQTIGGGKALVVKHGYRVPMSC